MQNEQPVYAKTIEETIASVSTDKEQGLSSKEAEKRLKKHGENKLEESEGVSLIQIFFRQFKSVVMLLLSVAAIASFFIGETVEAIAVVVVIVITAILGLIMEYKAGKSIEALKKTVKMQAKVLRDGEIRKLSTRKIVRGDIVILEEGDKVPADGRIIEAEELSVDESMLTGESDPINKEKDTLDASSEVEIANRYNMIYMGTSVLNGSGKYIVTQTGHETEIGKISKMLKETEDEVTPLEKRLEQTGRYLIILTLIITGIVAVIGYFTGKPLEEMLKTSIALAIAAVPEGLPAAATITLAIGMNRMAKKKALMRNLPAVETLGSATVLCADKTGTLTENEMTLQKIVIDNREIHVSGTGYEPEGEFESETGSHPKEDEALRLFLTTGLLCSDAVLTKNDRDQWEVIGDPTEGALVVGARKAGLKKEELEKDNPRVDTIPFDSEKKYMAVLYDSKTIYLKGAPEVVLDICGQVYKEGDAVPLDDEKRKALKEENTRLAKESYRVLALAYKKPQDTIKDELEDEINDEMIFLGLAAMMDPPRKDIKESIDLAKQAGIRTIMLTGDQKDTAMGIAKEIGISTDEESVYARVAPEDKLNIIGELKGDNEIVAMTGDGVNDAPALKKADIGVAMGMRGTSVAKEASDMILLDDRFSTIVEAVRQGRVIFDNIQKFIHYLLTCNLSEIVFIFYTILAGLPVPLVALQILWLNVVTGVFPALAMAWEIPEDDVMKKNPRHPKSPIITDKYKFQIGLQGILLAVGPLIAYLIAINSEMSMEVSRTIGFMTLAMVHLLQVFNVRRKNGLGYDKTFIKNIYMMGAIILTISLQLSAIYIPALQDILQTTALSLDMWKYVLLGMLIPNITLQLIAIIKKAKKAKKGEI